MGTERSMAAGAAAAGPLDVERLDTIDERACAAALAPLFEGAPRFLRRICAVRPFGDEERFFGRALEVALAMPVDEQVELIDAHPRLGAPASEVSDLSFREQGYERPTSDAPDLATELERLNEAYERRFGFRYCTFVAGRSRAELMPEFKLRLENDADAERDTALRAVVAIARDRAVHPRVLSGERA